VPEKFEEKYEDVLQNIEFGIQRVYQEHSEMTDWDALKAIEALIRVYQAKARKRDAPQFQLALLPQETFDSVQLMCEWRLGRAEMVNDQGARVDAEMKPKTVDEIVLCLKRVRRSIEFWNRKGGRQGYLKFVSQFVK
jgi:hypothetical protein